MTGRRWFAPRNERASAGVAVAATLVAILPFVVAIVVPRRSSRRPGRRLRADGSARPRRLVVRHPPRRRIQPVRVEPSGTGGLLRDRTGVRTVRETGVGNGRRQRARARTDRCRGSRWLHGEPVASRACSPHWRSSDSRTAQPDRRWCSTLGTRTSRTRCSCCSCCSPGCSQPVTHARSSESRSSAASSSRLTSATSHSSPRLRWRRSRSASRTRVRAGRVGAGPWRGPHWASWCCGCRPSSTSSCTRRTSARSRTR